jgi:hypothetical protein
MSPALRKEEFLIVVEQTISVVRSKKMGLLVTKVTSEVQYSVSNKSYERVRKNMRISVWQQNN